MVWLRLIVRHGLLLVDRIYRRRHRLQPVGEVLYVGRQRYQGPARAFPDGTRLVPGDPVGTLHFNNERIVRIEADNARQAALRFARLMRASLRRLAGRTSDPEFSDLVVFQGLSWLAPHGRAVGFVTQPGPDHLSMRLRTVYFWLLVWAFAPAEETRATMRTAPTVFWLTRTQLLQRFATPSGAPEDDRETAT